MLLEVIYSFGPLAGGTSIRSKVVEAADVFNPAPRLHGDHGFIFGGTLDAVEGLLQGLLTAEGRDGRIDAVGRSALQGMIFFSVSTAKTRLHLPSLAPHIGAVSTSETPHPFLPLTSRDLRGCTGHEMELFSI